MFPNLIRNLFTFSCLIGSLIMTTTSTAADQQTLRIATFNVSMDASNYLPEDQWASDGDHALLDALNAHHPQIKGIAEILQRVRPDIVLLNEFDYYPDHKAVDIFREQFLQTPQNGEPAIDYPYAYTATVNTGKPSPFDLNHDGKAAGKGDDAWGFGWYPGQYGMVILSRYPILTEQVRTFQNFLWQDLPNHHRVIDPVTDQPWYSDEIMAQFPLSSKSHWDVPVKVGNKVIHLLAAHPTPPVFDGKENRNGIRNFDEIRLWADYLSPNKADYIYDDAGNKGGLAASASFVLVGDMNAGPGEGANLPGAIEQLLEHPRVQDPQPQSAAAAAHTPNNPDAKFHTAAWRKRADYVLPSKDLKVKDTGIFWPAQGEPGYNLMKTRDASSDHRLVWLDIQL